MGRSLFVFRCCAISVLGLSSGISLAAQGSVGGALGQASANTKAQRVAKEKPPAPAVPKDFRIPAGRTFELSNGLKVTLIPYGIVPKAAFQLSVQTGIIDEGPQDVSLSSVTADMMLEGTTTRSAQDISRESADMGGSITVTAGNEATSVSGEVLAEYMPAFVTLAADVVKNPRFDSADLSRVLDKNVRDNAIALAQPASLAYKRFLEVTYGNHPFARSLPDEAMVRAFNVDRVKAFHDKNFGAKRSHIYVTGVFDAKKVEQAIRDSFGTWAAGAPPTDNPPTVAAKRQIDLTDRPGSVQTSMFLGVPTANPKSSDWMDMVVTNYLLGGAFGSRITSNIREDKGYTYSPRSGVIARRASGVWVEQADVTTKDTGPAIREIFKEMSRLGSEAPSQEELSGIQKALAGDFIMTASSRTGLISQLSYADRFDLGSGYVTSYVKKVMAVTPDQVSSAARKYLDPALVSIVMVGDKRQVEPQLGPFKPIQP